MSKDLLVVPTYNELQTLPVVLERIHRANPGLDVLVVDDSSPDGTGKWLDDVKPHHNWLYAMHRPSKSGLASAYIDGFRWAIKHRYETVGEMDADGSHRPEEYSRLLNRSKMPDRPDLVIGARWVPGGSAENWNWKRQLLSRSGNAYIKVMLGLGLADATGGFRCYRISCLNFLDDIESDGYGFQVEMAYRLAGKGGKIVEVPIGFEERIAGESKMDIGIVIEELANVTIWGTRRLLG